MEESNDVEWQWEEEKKAQVQVTVSFGHKFNMEATYADTLRWTWASSGKCSLYSVNLVDENVYEF